jgi:hypothetical protein
MNGVRTLAGELRETRNTVRELDGPEVLRELKAIKYIMEGLESNCDGFMLKEKSIAQDIRSEQKFSPDTPHVRNLQGEGESYVERRTPKSH